jgi:hypothetical protein
MSKRKVPDTCAKCVHANKTGLDITEMWGMWRCCRLEGEPRIPCRPGRLPLPLKDCPLKGK